MRGGPDAVFDAELRAPAEVALMPDPMLTLLPQSSDDVPEHTFYREDVDGEDVEYPGPVGISFSAAPWPSAVLEWGCKPERLNFDYAGDAAACIAAFDAEASRSSVSAVCLFEYATETGVLVVVSCSM